MLATAVSIGALFFISIYAPALFSAIISVLALISLLVCFGHRYRPVDGLVM